MSLSVKFKIIHPFHPKVGKEYKLIERKCCWGEDRIIYLDENDKMKIIHTLWTDYLDEDPFITVSKGRSDFKFDDLKSLYLLLKSIDCK
jgi:hypothetical protein